MLLNEINEVLSRTNALKEVVKCCVSTTKDENVARCVDLVGKVQNILTEMEDCLKRKQDDDDGLDETHQDGMITHFLLN